MKLRHTLIACITLLMYGVSYSQLTENEIRDIANNGSESEILMESSTLTADGYLYYAEILADKLLELKPESPNYHYRKGFLMLKVRTDYEGAIPHFEKAIQDLSSNWDMYSHNEKSAPTDALYHLAECLHMNEEIDRAKEFYNRFKTESKKKSELLPLTDLRLKQCDVAKSAMASPVNVRLENIGEKINTSDPEYSPVVSLDGSALYFSSRRAWENGESDGYKNPQINQFTEDVYVSYSDDNSTWSDPKRLDFCLPLRNEATIALSTDERRIYLYLDSTSGNGDIYHTDFYRAKFQDIKKLGMEGINSEYWESHCMMSHDKQLFFFVSDRPGGFGGRDIYYVKRTGENSWSEPINLGPGINGPNDEDSPFISINNKTLYFSTNGEKSIGGFDIMKSDFDVDNNTWGEGQNLGYPFNSTCDDIYYTTTIDGRRGYMTSFRKGGYGEKDIYEIFNDYLGIKDLAVLKGKIKTTDGSPLPEDFAINVNLVCVDCDENSRLIYPRLRDGVYMTGLEPCKTYRLEYMHVMDGTILHEDGFTTLCDEAYQEIYKELLYDPETGKIVVPEDTLDLTPVDVATYPNLEFMHYFGYNKNKLSVNKGDLKKFIKQVEAQLKEGRENVTINIYSSASNVPTKTYGSNEKLTKLRAENMKYDLVAHFEKKEKYNGKVNVVIVTTIVQGPEYVKDAGNRDKYKPYQYVGLKTE